MQTEEFQLGPLKMFVSQDHRFGTDAFLLAHYANIHRSDAVCDLCTGCGIIPLIFCKKDPPKAVYAVDIQDEAVELLQKSVAENALGEIIRPVLCDLKDIPNSVIPWETLDVVTANPPYMTGGSGYEKLSKAQAIARHELLCGIGDVCRAAFRLLKYGGRLVMCHRPERLADVLCAMRENRIEPKSVTFVYNLFSERPWLFLVSGKKGAAAGMNVEKPFVLQNEDRTYTREYSEIYE